MAHVPSNYYFVTSSLGISLLLFAVPTQHLVRDQSRKRTADTFYTYFIHVFIHIIRNNPNNSEIVKGGKGFKINTCSLGLPSSVVPFVSYTQAYGACYEVCFPLPAIPRGSTLCYICS